MTITAGNRIRLTTMEIISAMVIIQPKAMTGSMLLKSREANPTAVLAPA
jgi:hypothetical protein